MDASAIKTTIRRKVGRPRRLTLEAIIDAACEIGVGKLEMGLVAERLNTGVATLYSYVEGRDHLLRLVAERLSGRSVIEDRGQSWQELLTEHATISSALFEAVPDLLSNLISGMRNEKAGEYSGKLLGMMVSRGFELRNAIDIYVEVTQLVIGAAICRNRKKLLKDVSIDEHGVEIPLPDGLGDFRPTLKRVFADIERTRGSASAPR